MNRISLIRPSDGNARAAAHERWGAVAKPLGSLGLLEEMIERIAAIQGNADVDISKRAAVVMCADNGVVAEGVTQSDSEITAVCARSIAEGESNINIIARTFGAEVFAYDVGIARDVDCAALIKCKTAYGTGNIAVEPAMTVSQAESAITVGLDAVRKLSERGYKLIVTGEMGIGNTTTAAAVAAAVLGLSPREVTGRGAGLDSAGLERKISAVERALALHKPSVERPVELISRIGGFDIAAMTGLFLGGAVYRVPVIIDGVISAAAAALAVLINENVREYMLASHTSEEPAAKGLLEFIGAGRAPINAGLRLGEGTGGAMLLPLLDAALAVYNSSHSFESLKMERYVELS